MAPKKNAPVDPLTDEGVILANIWTRLLIRTKLARLLPGVRRRLDGGQEFLHYYSDRLLDGPHAALRDAGELLEQPDEPDRIDLAQCNPPIDLAPSMSTKLPAERRGYPPSWGLLDLRLLLAQRFEAEQQLHVRPEDEVLITHGVAGALSVVLDTFLNAGDRAALFDPSSPLYSWMLRHRRIRPAWLQTWIEDGKLRFKHDDLARTLKGARLLLLDVPHNPTGAWLAPEDVEEIVWWADRHDVLIFCDQAFDRFQFDGVNLRIGSLVKTHRRTLTAGSVSKGHGLAAARVGWLAGNRHLIRPCAVSAIAATPFVPTLCQQLALAALKQTDESFTAIRAEFNSRRRYAFDRLQGMGLKPSLPAGGFFFWLPVSDLGCDGREFAMELRKEQRVLVWPGEHFGPSGKKFIRLSIATDEGRFREGLTRLGEFVRAPQSPATTDQIQAA